MSLAVFRPTTSWTLQRISVIGPSSFDQDKTCIAGMSCAIRNIEGYFTSSGDALMVAATCGQSEALIHGLSRSGLMLPDAQVNSTFRWLLTSTSAQGGQYRLCWCADGQVCSTMEHFTVDVGAFSLLGPTPMQQAFTCVAGRECSIDPHYGLSFEREQAGCAGDLRLGERCFYASPTAACRCLLVQPAGALCL